MKDVERLRAMLMKNEEKESLLKEQREQIALDMKEKSKKARDHRRHVREAKRKEMRDCDQRGITEYRKYLKEVEDRQSQLRDRQRLLSELEFESYKRKYDHTSSNFATFYERQRERDQEIEENLQDIDERLNKKHQASVIGHFDKVERAREITEKMRAKQAEHEILEKKRIEEVFSQYVTRRLEAE